MNTIDRHQSGQQPTEAQQILNNMYGLMMEINLHRSDEDILAETDTQDPFIRKHLQKIKQLTAKYTAVGNQSKFQQLKDEIQRLKELGIEEVKKLLNPQDQMQLQPLFRKFEELTEADEQSILEDQELLQMIEYLKTKGDSDEQTAERGS